MLAVEKSTACSIDVYLIQPIFYFSFTSYSYRPFLKNNFESHLMTGNNKWKHQKNYKIIRRNNGKGRASLTDDEGVKDGPLSSAVNGVENDQMIPKYQRKLG